MPIFAELSVTDWLLLIPAIFFGIQQTLKMYLDWRADQRQKIRDESVMKKQDETTNRVEEVHKVITNGTRPPSEK